MQIEVIDELFIDFKKEDLVYRQYILIKLNETKF